jgi:hypothetical protein
MTSGLVIFNRSVLECLLEPHHSESFREMLHEFFIVNSSIPVDVGGKPDCDNFVLCQSDASFHQAVDILSNFEESILISIVFLEQLKEIKHLEYLL